MTPLYTYARTYLRVRKNYLLHRKKIIDYFNRRYLVPKVLYFECTNICNARCVFCPYPKISPHLEKKHMEVEFFRDILAQYEGAGGRTVALTPTIGDPLMDKYFHERMRIINGSTIQHVYFYTNLINFSEKTEGALDQAHNFTVKIVVSIAGFDRNAYREIMGVDMFGHVMENIGNLARYAASRKNITVHAKLIDYRGSGTARAELIQFLEKHHLTYNFETHLDTWGGHVKEEISNRKILKRKVLLHRLGPCKISFIKPVVTVDGNLKICDCRDFRNELTVGSLHEKGLAELCRGEEIERLRNRMYHPGDMPDICRKCEMYSSIFDFKC